MVNPDGISAAAQPAPSASRRTETLGAGVGFRYWGRMGSSSVADVAGCCFAPAVRAVRCLFGNDPMHREAALSLGLWDLWGLWVETRCSRRHCVITQRSQRPRGVRAGLMRFYRWDSVSVNITLRRLWDSMAVLVVGAGMRSGGWLRDPICVHSRFHALGRRSEVWEPQMNANMDLADLGHSLAQYLIHREPNRASLGSRDKPAHDGGMGVA